MLLIQHFYDKHLNNVRLKIKNFINYIIKNFKKDNDYFTLIELDFAPDYVSVFALKYAQHFHAALYSQFQDFYEIY